jgi:nucleoside-diphosphate-sugar epimerase
VTLVNRSGQVEETLPTGVTVVRADITDSAQLADVCADADVVFHCAQPGYTEWPQKFPPLTVAVIEGIARTQAKLVAADNLYMYGPTDGAPIHEDLPYAATGHKGRTRAQVANRLLDAHKAGRIQVVLGRASDFYGPRVQASAVGDLVFEAALAGKTANLLGTIDLPHTYTYIRDFAWGLVELSEHDEAFGRAWHVPSAETLTTRQFLNLIEAEIGRPIKIQTANRLMVWLIGLFNPMLREFNEMYYEFGEAYTVDHSQFERAFGSRVTPHKDAIRETVAWYRQRMEQKR